jgi:hypothetical protein
MPAFDGQGRRIIGNYIPGIALSAVGIVVFLAIALAWSWRAFIRHKGLEKRRFGTFLWPAILGCYLCADRSSRDAAAEPMQHGYRLRRSHRLSL